MFGNQSLEQEVSKTSLDVALWDIDSKGIKSVIEILTTNKTFLNKKISRAKLQSSDVASLAPYFQHNMAVKREFSRTPFESKLFHFLTEFQDKLCEIIKLNPLIQFKPPIPNSWIRPWYGGSMTKEYKLPDQ